MGFFERFFNWVKAFFGVSRPLEQPKTTEEVYRSVIDVKSKQYNDLKHKTMKIKSLRDEHRNELQAIADEVGLINQELDYALNHGDDEAALELLGIHEDRESHLKLHQVKTDELTKQAELAMRAVESFQVEIRALRRELEHAKTVEASVELQALVQECSTFSMDEDMKALEKVREECARRQAMAEIDRELEANSFESKRAQLQDQISNDQNQHRLEALKRLQNNQMAH